MARAQLSPLLDRQVKFSFSPPLHAHTRAHILDTDMCISPYNYTTHGIAILASAAGGGKYFLPISLPLFEVDDDDNVGQLEAGREGYKKGNPRKFRKRVHV